MPFELLQVFFMKDWRSLLSEQHKKPQITSPMNGCLLFALNLHSCRLLRPECISAYTKHEIKNKEAKNNYEGSINCENTFKLLLHGTLVYLNPFWISFANIVYCTVFRMLKDNIFRVPHDESSMHVEAKTFWGFVIQGLWFYDNWSIS